MTGTGVSFAEIATHAVPPPATGLFSNGLVSGRTIYLSGQHAGTITGPVGGDDMYLQAKEAFRRVVALIGAAGAGTRDVVKMTIYVTDMDRTSEIGRARREVFTEAPQPCSTLVGVASLVDPRLLVEVDAVAIIPEGELAHP